MSNDWGRWNDLVECPHCGYEELDSWELNGSDGKEVECLSCGGRMELSVNFEVRYATKKVVDREPETEERGEA